MECESIRKLRRPIIGAPRMFLISDNCSVSKSHRTKARRVENRGQISHFLTPCKTWGQQANCRSVFYDFGVERGAENAGLENAEPRKMRDRWPQDWLIEQGLTSHQHIIGHIGEQRTKKCKDGKCKTWNTNTRYRVVSFIDTNNTHQF